LVMAAGFTDTTMDAGRCLRGMGSRGMGMWDMDMRDMDMRDMARWRVVQSEASTVEEGSMAEAASTVVAGMAANLRRRIGR
jgi:hypothetical protein